MVVRAGKLAPVRRYDLHNHTEESDAVVQHWVAKLFDARECYIKARDTLFQATRVRGLDGLAITNHDRIGDALRAAERYPEQVIVGCEYSVPEGDGYLLHVVVLDVEPGLHERLDKVRKWGLERFAREVQRADRPYFLAHVAWGTFHDKPMTPPVVEGWLRHFRMVETLNSTRTTENVLADKLARYYGLAGIGGSDGHELHSIGRAWTEAPAATCKASFIEEMRHCRVRPGGEGGGVAHFRRTVKSIAAGFYLAEWDRVRAAGGPGAYLRSADPLSLARNAFELAAIPSLPLLAHMGSVRQVQTLEDDVERLTVEFVDYLRERAYREALEADASDDERRRLLAEGLARIATAFGPETLPESARARADELA